MLVEFGASNSICISNLLHNALSIISGWFVDHIIIELLLTKSKFCKKTVTTLFSSHNSWISALFLAIVSISSKSNITSKLFATSNISLIFFHVLPKNEEITSSRRTKIKGKLRSFARFIAA
jgi:hypothetical protein